MLAAALALYAAWHIYPFLAPNEPQKGARVLVVEGWLTPKELDQAAAVFKAGPYKSIITTGGPIEDWREYRGSASYAERAARYLRLHGLQAAAITAVPAPASAQDRTFLSAVMVREWAAKNGKALTSFDVFSAGTHARRSHMLYRLAFGSDAKVGVLSAHPDEYDEYRWWRTSAGAKAVMGEMIGILWTSCCFSPPERGSHAEKWGARRSSSP